MITKRTTFNLALAGLLIAVATGLGYAKHLGVVGAEVPVRGTMALIGIGLAFYANLAPKSVSSSAKTQSIRRAAGWAGVVAGLGSAAIWAFAPIGIAAVASMCAVAIGFACMVSYCVWTRSRPA